MTSVIISQIRIFNARETTKFKIKILINDEIG